MKKTLSFLLAIAMVMSLAACGSKQDPAGSQSGEKSTGTTGPVNLVAAHIYGADTVQNQACQLFAKLLEEKKLAAKAGAGTLVPITGFANAVVAPAIEFRNEGLVSGVGAKMFIIAGPVIVYGMLASVVWGVIYHFIRPLMGG